jgi:hypothetical protein
LTRSKPPAKAIPYERFQDELKRQGGGGGPENEGPDLFRIFRDKAQALRNSAKGLLRPLLPAAGDKIMTPELMTFNRIAQGGFMGTVTAIRVLMDHKMHNPRQNI